MPLVYPSSSAKEEVESANVRGHTSTDFDQRPTLRLLSSNVMYRSRPGDLYLTAATIKGRLTLVISYDRNAWDDVLVEEWLEEIRGAANHYLVTEQQRTRVHVQARL
jgi:septum formation topological specificity factor MinE